MGAERWIRDRRERERERERERLESFQDHDKDDERTVTYDTKERAEESSDDKPEEGLLKVSAQSPAVSRSPT